LRDLSTNPPADLVPIISGKWELTFRWDGRGTMPPEEKTTLRSLTQEAHEQNRTIRFWGAPDNPNTWAELKEAGVDWLNTDRLAEASEFLRSASGQASK